MRGDYKFVWKQAVPSLVVAGLVWLAIVTITSLNAHAFLWHFSVILGIAMVPIGLSGGLLPD